MTQTQKPIDYTCASCGKRTHRRHPCQPSTQTGAYLCQYCGVRTDDPHHVCSPMLVETTYYCGDCGRVSVHRDDVCRPKAIT